MVDAVVLFKCNHLWKYQYGMPVMAKVLHNLSVLCWPGLCGDCLP